jgi:hypothetical protein
VRVNAQPLSQPKPKMQLPRVDAVIKAVRERDGALRQEDIEPTVPMRVGFEADGTPIRPTVTPGDKPFRGPMPKPVMTGGGADGGSSKNVLAPFSYANLPTHRKEVVIAGVKQTIEVKRKLPELIDRLPRHPNADDPIVQ